MTIPGLSEATIRAHASPDSYSRGASYYQRGAVGELALRGDTLQAEVEGSQYTPYRVRISFDAGGVTDADCTCPYDWGGWCKHIVAALLKCAAEPDAIERRPPLDELLNELDRSQLLALLVALADLDPDTADEIERRAGLMRLASAAPATAETVQPRPAGAPTRRAPIDQAAIRQQIRLALRPARRGRYDYDYYDDEDPGGEIVEAVRPLLGQARGFIDGGDARSALAVLEALTDEYIDGCRALGNDFEESYGISIGESSAGEFFGELAEAWAEAVLGADLDDEERDEWGELLAGWRDDADDFGAGMAMDLAVTAADQGWDYPPLQRVFQGEITERGAWEGERPDYA
ncbi:MAG TPA: SWIM zinc finger family protein, partial [Roseiflexaceae bacterium]